VRRIRITALTNSDPLGDLRRLATVRRDLYVHSQIEIDPDNPAHESRRDEQHRAYFEFSTDDFEDVRRVLRDFGHIDHVAIVEVPGPVGTPCLNCGHVAGPIMPSECPSCGFREISRCPHCLQEVARQQYEWVSGDLFRCPRCYAHVWLRFNDPLIRADGGYNQPVVVVEVAAQQPA
jgi:hypothetical protein